MGFEINPPFTRRQRRAVLLMAFAAILAVVFFGLMAQHETEASARLYRAHHPVTLR